MLGITTYAHDTAFALHLRFPGFRPPVPFGAAPFYGLPTCKVEGSGLLPPSATHACGYNSCGCNLRMSEIRSGSFGVGLGPVWGRFGHQAGPKSTPNDPGRTSDNFELQPHALQPHP